MLVPSIFVPYLEVISNLIGLFGVVLVIWAVTLTIYRIIRIEVFHEKRFHQHEHTKRVLIQKVILALDFFVSADLIMLAMVQNMEEIISIAFIVAIRTVLSWSLSREVHLHKE